MIRTKLEIEGYETKLEIERYDSTKLEIEGYDGLN